MIDLPDKGTILIQEVPSPVLLDLYKLHHEFTLPTALYYNDESAIDLYSGDGQIQESEEYKRTAEWLGHSIKEFRLERMNPIGEMANAYLWNSRIPDVDFDPSELKKNLSGGWPSLFWHADTYQPENRIKMIIYLNNVSESNGAVCMEKDLMYINDDSYSEVKNKYTHVDQIEGKFFNGTPGTAIIFRARQLHRINFPLETHRDTIHIGFENE